MREALKLALEALEDPAILNGVNNAKFLIKEVLAQPEQEQTGIREIRVTETVKQEQEPVAWMCAPFGDMEYEFSAHQECENCVPCYATPPKREGVKLTDEQIEQRIGYRLPAYGFDAIRQLIKENT